jgi:DNA transposition AAA+ family ATPase
MAKELALVESAELAVKENPGDTVRASWNFSLDKIRSCTAHYSAEDQEILVALFRWCIDPQHPIRRDDAARRIGCSPNLLYQLLTGVYRNPDKSLRGPSPELVHNIQEFLALEAKRLASGKNEFVMTPTARKIFTACDLARESQSPVILWSTSHLGKTWALKEYAAKNNHGKTFVAEMDAASGLGGMVRVLANACGVTGKGNTADLIERIKRALTSDTVLIIDEMHLLRHTYRLQSFFACVEVIRRIYDFTQCGMVLSWTNLENLKSASQGELIQIWRRGVHKIALANMPTKSDLAAILSHNGLQFPERDLQISVGSGKGLIVESPYEILRQQSKQCGLKAITERIRYARKLANKAGEKITWNHFCDAHLRIEKAAQAESDWS